MGFAKDTHNALKHRPVYQKRNRQLPSPDGKEEKEHSPPNKKKKSKDKVEGKFSKQSKGKDKPEFTVGASVIDDEIMNTPEIDKEIVTEDLESVKVSDSDDTSTNNGEKPIQTECATESEDSTKMSTDTDAADDTDNTETAVEDSIENDRDEGKSNLQPISDEILKYENIEEPIK